MRLDSAGYVLPTLERVRRSHGNDGGMLLQYEFRESWVTNRYRGCRIRGRRATFEAVGDVGGHGHVAQAPGRNESRSRAVSRRGGAPGGGQPILLECNLESGSLFLFPRFRLVLSLESPSVVSGHRPRPSVFTPCSPFTLLSVPHSFLPPWSQLSFSLSLALTTTSAVVATTSAASSSAA